MKRKAVTALLTCTMAFGFLVGGGVPQKGGLVKIEPVKQTPPWVISVPSDPTIKFR